MRIVLTFLATSFLLGCGSYKGSEIWRRSACEDIADVDDRAQCLEQATRSESEYRREVEEASKNQEVVTPLRISFSSY